jgi:hypothetical protein
MNNAVNEMDAAQAEIASQVKKLAEMVTAIRVRINEGTYGKNDMRLLKDMRDKLGKRIPENDTTHDGLFVEAAALLKEMTPSLDAPSRKGFNLEAARTAYKNRGKIIEARRM